MADPTVDQASLMQAILPVAGSVYWHALISTVDPVERVFAIDDSPPNVDLPAPIAAFAIDDFWDDPQIAPPPPGGEPGAPTFPLNVVPGSVPLGGYVEGDDDARDELRELLGMAPFDDAGDDTGPHEVARAAMRTWLGSLGLSVAFAGLNAENPRAGRRPGLPRVSIFFPSVAWDAHSPRQLREKATIGPFAVGSLAESELGVPDDVRGELAHDANGRAINRVGDFEARFMLRFEFARRSEARAIRREMPLALSYIAHRTDDPGLQGGQQTGVVRLPVTFEGVEVAREEVSLYFDGSDTLAQAADTATRDRWILEYSGMAAYPWIEAGVSRTDNELGVRVELNGTITDFEDFREGGQDRWAHVGAGAHIDGSVALGAAVAALLADPDADITVLDIAQANLALTGSRVYWDGWSTLSTVGSGYLLSRDFSDLSRIRWSILDDTGAILSSITGVGPIVFDGLTHLVHFQDLAAADSAIASLSGDGSAFVSAATYTRSALGALGHWTPSGSRRGPIPVDLSSLAWQYMHAVIAEDLSAHRVAFNAAFTTALAGNLQNLHRACVALQEAVEAAVSDLSNILYFEIYRENEVAAHGDTATQVGVNFTLPGEAW